MNDLLAKFKAPDSLLNRLGITQRQWKSKKRKELKALMKAMDTYRSGCAYCPNPDREIRDLERILKKMKANHSIKEWGR